CGVNKSVENAIRATTRVFGNGRLNPHGCGGLRAKNGIFGGELSNPGGRNQVRAKGRFGRRAAT
ncbi:MAG: hypothetical protein Q8O33_14010, partial [Pseudomonadota bacterium]|nr:hypothetical protein [Pseudomonadota bacterium]